MCYFIRDIAYGYYCMAQIDLLHYVCMCMNAFNRYIIFSQKLCMLFTRSVQLCDQSWGIWFIESYNITCEPCKLSILFLWSVYLDLCSYICAFGALSTGSSMNLEVYHTWWGSVHGVQSMCRCTCAYTIFKCNESLIGIKFHSYIGWSRKCPHWTKWIKLLHAPSLLLTILFVAL